MVEESNRNPDSRPLGFISRRGLLKFGLLGGTVFLMGGGGGLLALRGRAPRVPGLLVLSNHEYRTLAALARVHAPQGGPFEVGAESFDLARMFDGFLADEPSQNIRDLKLALCLIEYGPLLFDWRLSTFSNLAPDEQLRHWQSWMTSSRLFRRKAATAFRKFLSFAFYTQPEVTANFGYELPTFWR